MARLQLQNLIPGIEYKLQLRARDGDTVSDWSRRFTLTAGADVDAPDPVAWAVSNDWVVNGDTFVGNWQAINPALVQNFDFDHYELELGDTVVTRNVSTTNLTYTLDFEGNRILFGTPKATVTARVRAVDRDGNASAWNSLKSATNPAPAQASTITVTGLYDAVDVKWDPGTLPDDFKSYVLQYSTTSNSTGFSSVYEGPNPQFTHSTTLSTTDHWYRVAIKDKFGSLSPYLVSSAVRPKNTFAVDTTAPSAPTGVTPTTSFDATRQTSIIDVSWTASVSTDVTGYEIRYATNTTNWQYRIVGPDVLATRLENLTPGQSYYIGVRAFDMAQNMSAWANASSYPVTTSADTTAPSTPQNPVVSAGTMQIQVRATGFKADGVTAMEPDTAFYEVYASTTTGFTPGTTNMVGTIPVGPALIGTFDVPTSGGASTQTWYVKVIAVDRSGNKSGASSQTTSTPGLIANANIIDATITAAKITSLNADSIIAGSGVINDITVKSKLTLGDASTVGYIETYDYTTSGGTTGAQFSKNGVIVKTGTIEAAALKIQGGTNIVPPEYANFEADSTLYATAAMGGTNHSTVQASTTPLLYGAKFLNFSQSVAGSGVTVYLGASTTDYNIPVVAGTTYIISGYYRNRTAVAANFAMGIKWSDGTSSTGTPVATTTSGTAWSNRFSFTATAPAGVTGGLAYVTSNTTTSGYTLDVDGVQVEPKLAGATTPSLWSPGVSTFINGSLIRTGSIQSTSLTGIGSTPLWSIPLNGSATFQNLLVRGASVIGVSGDNTSSYLKSYNFSTGSAGWMIDAAGNAEFNSGIFRGDILVGNSTDGYVNLASANGDIYFGSGTGRDSAGAKITTYSNNSSSAIRIKSGFQGTNSPDQASIEVESGSTLNSGARINLKGAPVYVPGGSIFISGTDNTVQIASPPSGSFTNNVNWNTANGNIRYNSSLSEIKLEQQPIDLETARQLFNVTPITWYDRGQVEELGGIEEGLEAGMRRVPGFVAEDFDENAPLWALYRDDGLGDLMAVQYDRVPAGLLVISKDHEARIAELEALVATLTARLG